MWLQAQTNEMGTLDRAEEMTNSVELKVTRQVYILLLSWNNWKDTNDCLASLQALDYDNWRALVLDNGSTDASVQRIRERFPQVEIIELGENLGFTKGNNAGIRVALERGADYVWLLNNDTVVEPRTLGAMVARAEGDSKIGAVGSAIYYMEEPARLQAWGGGKVNFWLGQGQHFESPVSDDKLEFIMGASLLVCRRALNAVGLLDEGFFIYWEDADYCFRLRRSGWRLAVAENARLWHKESASMVNRSARKDTLSFKSAVRFFARHSPVPLISIGVGMSLRLGQRVVTGDWRRALAIWAGFRQANVGPLLGQNLQRSQ